MAQFFEHNDKFFEVAQIPDARGRDRSTLVEVPKSDVIGRAGSGYRTIADIKAKPLSPFFLRPMNPSKLKTKKSPELSKILGREVIVIDALGTTGSVIIPNRATGKAAGLSDEQIRGVPATGKVVKSQEFSKYLEETGQEFSPEKGFTGGERELLPETFATGGQADTGLGYFKIGKDVYENLGGGEKRKIEMDEFKRLGINFALLGEGLQMTKTLSEIGGFVAGAGEEPTAFTPETTTQALPRELTGLTPGEPFDITAYNEAVVRGDVEEMQRLSGTPTEVPVGAPTGAVADGVLKRGNDVFIIENGVERKLTLAEFKQLGINFDFLQEGVPVSLTQAQTGQAGDAGAAFSMDDIFEQVIAYLEANNWMVNPEAQITPESVASFLKQLETDDHPIFSQFREYAKGIYGEFYEEQFQVARENLYRDLGYSTKDIQLKEAELERQYGKSLERIGEEEALAGRALSGVRQERERELAEATQRQLEAGRREQEFAARTDVRSFAELYGGARTPTDIGFPTVAGAPRVLPGVGKFANGFPGFEVTDSMVELEDRIDLESEALKKAKGTKTFEQAAEERALASETEEAFRKTLL